VNAPYRSTPHARIDPRPRKVPDPSTTPALGDVGPGLKRRWRRRPRSIVSIWPSSRWAPVGSRRCPTRQGPRGAGDGAAGMTRVSTMLIAAVLLIAILVGFALGRMSVGDIVRATSAEWITAIATLMAVGFAARSAKAAADAALATQHAAEGALVLNFLQQYATAEMLEDLRVLRAWRQDFPDNWVDRWSNQLPIHGQQGKRARRVDLARRRVTSYFYSADELHRLKLISTDRCRAIVDKTGLSVFFNINIPLEQALRPNVDLSFVSRLRALAGERELETPIPIGSDDQEA
jgi:hypothetical protein